MQRQYDVILVPLGAAAFGGAERSLIELAAETKRAGLEPLVLCGYDLKGTGFDDYAREKEIALRWVDWRPEAGALHNLKVAVRSFRCCPAPIIHFNISWRPWMWLIVLAAKAMTQCALIGTMRAMPDPFDDIRTSRHFGVVPGIGLWRIAARTVGRVWARTLDITVSVNKFNYPARLTRDFGCDISRIRVICNGIRPVDLIVDEEPRPSVADSRAEVRVAFAGRVSREKGLDYLLRAIAVLPGYFSLTVIGDGDLVPELVALSTQLDISHRVRFLGFSPDIYPDLRLADIVVVPSVREEAFGRVVIEAMCLAKPVIATRVGGMAEIFADGVEGIYVPPCDVAALANAIDRLGSSESLRESIGRSARDRVLSDYTLDRVAAQYIELYRALASDSVTRMRFDAAARRLSELHDSQANASADACRDSIR